MMKKGYLATGLSVTLLLAGCFDDGRNGAQGTGGFGNPIYGAGGVDRSQLDKRPTGNGGNVILPRGDQQQDGQQQSTGNPDIDAKLKEAQADAVGTNNERANAAAAKALAKIVSASERNERKGTTLWQQECKTKDNTADISDTPANDIPGDGISTECKIALNLKQDIYHGWIATIMTLDANVMEIMITEKIAKMKQSKNPKTVKTAQEAEKELGRAKDPSLWTKGENFALKTSNLDRMVALWISVGKDYYKSDLGLYQELYARLRDPKYNLSGDALTGGEIFMDGSKHPNELIKNANTNITNWSSYELNQPFALLKGGYGKNDHVYINHEEVTRGNIKLSDMGGAGNNMATTDMKGKVVVAIYEAFAEKNFDTALMTVQDPQGNATLGVEGLAAFYVGGSLEGFSSRMGKGLGSIRATLGITESLKTKRGPDTEGAVLEGTVAKDNHMAAVFLSLEKAPPVASNFFAHLTDTKAGRYVYEMLPQHVARICPYGAGETIRSKKSASDLIAFQALDYCPGFETFNTDPCPAPGTPGVPSAPCRLQASVDAGNKVVATAKAAQDLVREMQITKADMNNAIGKLERVPSTSANFANVSTNKQTLSDAIKTIDGLINEANGPSPNIQDIRRRYDVEKSKLDTMNNTNVFTYVPSQHGSPSRQPANSSNDDGEQDNDLVALDPDENGVGS